MLYSFLFKKNELGGGKEKNVKGMHSRSILIGIVDLCIGSGKKFV